MRITHCPRSAIEQGDLLLVDAHHGLAQVLGQRGDELGVGVVGDGLYNGRSSLGRIARLEDAGADKHALGAQLHHQGCVGRASPRRRRRS